MVIFDCEYDSGGICQTIYSYNCSFRFFILYPGIIFCFFGCMAAYYIQAHQVYQGSGSPPATDVEHFANLLKGDAFVFT